jgi:FixJ family two-component response regulator
MCWTKVQCAGGFCGGNVMDARHIPCRHRLQARPLTTPKVTPLIAIVDDDPSIGRAVERLLRSFGMRAETFQSGEGLLRAVESSQRFRCAVIDVQMPGMNGLEVQRRLALERIDLPLVFITAHEDEGVSELAIAAGAVGFLQKPFTDESLIELIRRALQSSSGDGIGPRSNSRSLGD